MPEPRRTPPRRVPPKRDADEGRSSTRTSKKYEDDADEKDYPDEPEERGSRRRSRDADDEDERPARRGRSRSRDDEDGGGDEDDRPALGSGWGAWDKAKQGTGGDFPDEFKVTEEDQVFKFLDDGPFASYKQHWINEVPGKKSWICLGADCPLCDIGDGPQARAAFNVVDLGEKKPTVKILIVGIKVGQVVATFNKQKATTPINRDDLYWVVNKSTSGGKRNTGGTVQTNLRPVKERDLYEDFEVEPLTEAELEALEKKAYDSTKIPTHGRKRLQEIADLLD